MYSVRACMCVRVCVLKLYVLCGEGGEQNLGAGCVGLQDVSRRSSRVIFL